MVGGRGTGRGGRLRLAWATLLVLALVASFSREASASTAGAEDDHRPALGFSNLVIRRDREDHIGLANLDYRVRILETLRKSGFNAVGYESLVFDRNDGHRAGLMLGGTVTEFRCAGNTTWLDCSIGVLWQVLDSRADKIVYEVMTRHVERDINGRTDSEVVGQRLVLGALASLMARPQFRQTCAGPSPEPAASFAEASYLPCASETTGMPASAEAVLSAAVSVRSDAGFGSGFFISSDGLILTAAHVVHSGKLEVGLRDGSTRVARVVRIARRADVALLSAGKGTSDSLSCLKTESAAQDAGTDVYAVGAPASLDLAFSLTRGVVSGYRVLDEARLLQTDASVSPGSSGGPIVNAKGHAVAITRSKVEGAGIEGVAFGIPIEIALHALALAPGASTAAPLHETRIENADASQTREKFIDTPDAPTLLDGAGPGRDSGPVHKGLPQGTAFIRYGSVAFAAVGAGMVVFSALAYQDGTTTHQHFINLRTMNDLGWGALGLGAVGFGVSFLLPGAPPPVASSSHQAGDVRLDLGLGSVAGTVSF